MKVIDSFGEICPIPVLRIQEELAILKPGESFMIVVDHSCVLESIKDKYKGKKIKMIIDEVMNGVWEITFTKL
ncbi:MAG: sulfurtransferase TusA family protein [Clostridia bacterium]|nr:sulfurtransferase TusA family protein [Clostridia bacterium]